MRTITPFLVRGTTKSAIADAARRVEEAQEALREALPKTTLSVYHEAQPVDGDEEAYESDFSGVWFGIWVNSNWYDLAWTEKDPDGDTYAVWTLDENGNERGVGVFPADTVVYYEE